LYAVCLQALTFIFIFRCLLRWWEKHGKGASVAATRVWVVEDDTVFTGSWASLLATMEAGLQKWMTGVQGHKPADLISFRDYCTPEKSWIWGRYMHEGWANLTAPGLGLETWMTAYGLSPKFLNFIAETQKNGTTGHIEWCGERRQDAQERRAAQAHVCSLDTY